MNLGFSKNLKESRVLLSHHWSFLNQRQPILAENTIYLTSSKETHSQVINFPLSSILDMGEVVKNLPSNWYPDLFIAKVDSFFNIVPSNVKALKCPKILILGDTQHGINPLNKMIEYAKSEKYDLYITDHKRHHLWYYWLAGLRNLYWLPGLFLNPPEANFKQQPWQSSNLENSLFQERTIFIGQAGQFHPRRKRIVEYAQQHIPKFFHSKLTQRDSLKAFATADISLNISLNGDVNLRNFEVIAAGGFLLGDKLTDESGMDLLLEEGKDYETFADIDEMLAKISYFSQHPEVVAKYRENSYGRYCNEYTPERLVNLLSRLLEGEEIEERFTTKSIKRIQYCHDTQFSYARIFLYQIIQDIHRNWEHLEILLDGRISFTSVVDFLDLPRLNVTLSNWDETYVATLETYLKKSSNSDRVRFVREIEITEEFNVIITSSCNAHLLSQLQSQSCVLISNDYQGLETASKSNELREMIGRKKDIEGFFFVLVTDNSQDLTFQSIDYLLSTETSKLEESRDITDELNLQEINLIVFPDWSGEEESIGLELQQVMQAIANHPNRDKITLLIDISDIDEQEANLFLSGVAMNLLMEEDLDVTEEIEISLIGHLTEVQWQTLLPHIQTHISLENENQKAIAQLKADKINSMDLLSFLREGRN